MDTISARCRRPSDAPISRRAHSCVVWAAMFALVLTLAATGGLPASARMLAADGDPSAMCLRSAEVAADRHGVPRDLMRALAEVESGRSSGGRVAPWPWTLNIAGEGIWFETRGAALSRARAAIADGVRSIDLGCFQVNHRWHGEAFDDLGDMLDPGRSADYAARLLARHHGETGDWLAAAGRYHSRTPRHFERYRARIRAALARGASDPPPPRSGQTAPTTDAGPLIRIPPRPEPSGDAAPPGGTGIAALTAPGRGLLARAAPAW